MANQGNVNEKEQIIKLIGNSIEKAVSDRVGQLFDEKMKEIIQKRDEVVSGTVLNIMSFLRVECFGEEIRILIKKDEVEKLKNL